MAQAVRCFQLRSCLMKMDTDILKFFYYVFCNTFIVLASISWLEEYPAYLIAMSAISACLVFEIFTELLVWFVEGLP